MDVVVNDPALPYPVRLEVSVLSSRGVEVRSVAVEVPDPTKAGSIKATELRKLKVDTYLRLALETVRQPPVQLDENTFTDASGSTIWGGRPVRQPGRGRPVGDDFLREVADIYRAAVAAQEKAPVDVVRRELQGTRSSAGRWVGQARQRGFLGDAVGPVAGEQERKKRRTR